MNDFHDQQDLERAKQPHPDILQRVKNAVGPAAGQNKYGLDTHAIERAIREKRDAQADTLRKQRHNLTEIKRKAAQRPLLMDRTDSLARARRRGLHKVRAALEVGGIMNIDEHFDDDEHNHLHQRDGDDDSVY